MRNFRVALVLFACFAAMLSTATAVDVSQLPPPAAHTVRFSEDIQPILENSCIRCHGVEKPKGRFSLVTRETALRGGATGAAIVPGDSAASPLIHYVAGLVEDMQMPPPGKGEPLTTEQIALIRAWIDQGAEWSDITVERVVRPAFSITPSFRVANVSGDKRKFREHFWTKDGINPGVEGVTVRQNIDEDTSISLDAHAFPLDEDYAASLSLERREAGFIRAGLQHFRRYYDDSGGFYPFTQPFFALDRDLHLDIGRAWIEAGITIPEGPQLTIGYEYRFREGAKSTLQWGTVRTTSAPLIPDTSVQRNIYPAFQELDEKVHIVKVDARHEIAGLALENNFRTEFYDLATHRQNALSLTVGQPAPDRSVIVDETHDETRLMNTFRLENEIRDWWFASAGYLYSAADADASFRQNTVHATGLPISGDYWNSQSILLKQDVHAFSINNRFGPWQDLTLNAGVQSEWVHQEGIGNVSLDEGNPATFLLIQPARFDANLDRHSLQENVGLRFTRIPYTSLFAEARLEQEEIGQFEQAEGGHHEFLRDTDAEVHAEDFRAGFYTAPVRRVSLGGHVRRRQRQSNYDHLVDLANGVPNESYPAFIRSRNIASDEIEAKLTVRPVNWLKTTLTYQRVDTNFDSDTDAVAGITPGGQLRAGQFDADVYGINLVLTPFARWYFTTTFNFYDSEATSAHNNVPSVAPYRGDIYNLVAVATYTVNEATDLSASYFFSRADYSQDNFADGLPAGISYDWHGIEAGITRRFKRATANLRYGFFDYDEPSSGGFNNYTAHAIFASVTLHWR